MLDFIGTVAIIAVIILTIAAFTGALPARVGSRFVTAAIFGAWTGLAIALAVAGEFDDAGRRPVPLIGILLSLALLGAGAGALFFPAMRRALLGVPMPLLIGLHVGRLVGGFFLLLALSGRLAGPFPYSAGWGDVITAVLAIPVAWLAARSTENRHLIQAWNVFGALDLIVAVALGVTSTPGSPLQIFHTAAGSAAVAGLPWALIPVVAVPFYLVTHAVIFAQLRR